MFKLISINEFDLIPRYDEIMIHPDSMKSLKIWPFEKVLFKDEKNEYNFIAIVKPDSNLEKDEIGLNSFYFDHLRKREINKAEIIKLKIEETNKAKEISLGCLNSKGNDEENLEKWGEWISRKIEGRLVCKRKKNFLRKKLTLLFCY